MPRLHTFFRAPTIVLVALLLAAALPLTTSHWTDEVKVTGTATMGHLEWDIALDAVTWNTNTVMEFGVSRSSGGDGPGEAGLVNVSIYNAYPNAYGTLMLAVENEGTIPVHAVIWVEPGDTTCPLMDYVLLNPAYDAPHYNGITSIYDYFSWSADVSSGWIDPWTHSVTWWITNHGDPSTAVAIEDITASGQVLKLNDDTSTEIVYDDDNIIMPGEMHVIFIWIGLSDDLQDHEELMGVSCRNAFYIHYVAVQAVP